MTIVLHRFIQYSFDFSQVKHTDTLHKIVQYLKDNYDRKITLDDVAAHVYLSRSYVSSIFKKEMGITIYRYIAKLRMNAAITLLNTSNYNVNEISEFVGYNDRRTFTEAFKKHFGISPTHFEPEDRQ